jgi:hypothetical protein
LSEKSRKIREGIINFFKERDCVTMVLPCTDEKDIKKMDSLPDSRIRPEFMREVFRIRDKIYRQCGAKKLNGSSLTSRMYVKMVEDYVAAINGGAVPMIQNAWQSVLQNECIQSLEAAKAAYTKASQEHFKDAGKVHRKAELADALKKHRELSLLEFEGISLVKDRDEELYTEYHQELVEFIGRKERQIMEKNNSLTEAHDTNLLNSATRDLKVKLSKAYFNSGNLHEVKELYRQ